MNPSKNFKTPSHSPLITVVLILAMIISITPKGQAENNHIKSGETLTKNKKESTEIDTSIDTNTDIDHKTSLKITYEAIVSPNKSLENQASKHLDEFEKNILSVILESKHVEEKIHKGHNFTKPSPTKIINPTKVSNLKREMDIYNTKNPKDIANALHKKLKNFYSGHYLPVGNDTLYISVPDTKGGNMGIKITTLYNDNDNKDTN